MNRTIEVKDCSTDLAGEILDLLSSSLCARCGTPMGSGDIIDDPDQWPSFRFECSGCHTLIVWEFTWEKVQSMTKKTNWQTLMTRTRNTATEKGWWSDEHGNPIELFTPSGEVRDVSRILERHALIHSELTEAWHEWPRHDGRASLFMRIENGKPEGFVVEIADAVIRIADLLASYSKPTTTNPLHVPYWKSLEVSPVNDLMEARAYLDDATEHIRVGNAMAWRNYLHYCVSELAIICKFLALDLDAAIEAKLTYNETREHRHGGKLA